MNMNEERNELIELELGKMRQRHKETVALAVARLPWLLLLIGIAVWEFKTMTMGKLLVHLIHSVSG